MVKDVATSKICLDTSTLASSEGVLQTYLGLKYNSYAYFFTVS
jgi:hypothetical protein